MIYRDISVRSMYLHIDLVCINEYDYLTWLRTHLWAVEHCTIPGILPCDVPHYHAAVVVCRLHSGR